MRNGIEELKNYIDKKITLVYQWHGCGQVWGKYKGGYCEEIDGKKCFYLYILPYKCRKIYVYKMFNTAYCTITNNFVIYEDWQVLYGLNNGGWGRPIYEDFYDFTHYQQYKILFEDMHE